MPEAGATLSPAERLGGRPLVLLGCGKMGGALLDGWLAAGIPGNALHILEPAPSAALTERIDGTGAILNPARLPAGPAVTVIAVKPQILEEALPQVRPLAAEGGLFVSIAAGIQIRQMQTLLGTGRIIRTMPNTPAAIGRGITALAAGPEAGEADFALAEALLGAVGVTLRLPDESGMDAVTAVSGSGPAYVFHLIEALAAAAEQEGLAPDLALNLARTTVAGAGALAEQSPKPPAELRTDVTSPGGTTAAGLVELMHAETGLVPLIARTVRAAARRSRELGAG